MHKKAFTLIELLVVITIIAILAVLVFMATTGLTRRARNSTTMATVREVGSAITLFRNNEGTSSQVIRLGSGELADHTVITGNDYWAPFTGRINTEVNTSGTFTADQELQYPVAVTRAASTAHVLHYRVFMADGTDVTLGSSQNREYFSLGVDDLGGCVIFSADLINENSTDVTSFYRNGTVSATDIVSSALSCSNP